MLFRLTKHTAFVFPLASALLALTVTSSNAIVIRHDVPDATYLGMAQESRFSGVGQMRSGGLIRGTGTYIGNGWILTAAHVADDAMTWSFRLDGVDHAVADFFIHPEWTGDPNENHDVALMQLSQPLNGFNPLPISTTSANVGDAVEIAGYGFTGTGLTGITDDGGFVLRAGTNEIEFDLNGFGLEYLVSFFDSPASGFATALEAQGAFNDSGGPLLRQTVDGWEIVAVTSFIQESLDGSGDGVLGNYGDLTGFADVPQYNDWINRVVPEPTNMVVLVPFAFWALKRWRKPSLGSL